MVECHVESRRRRGSTVRRLVVVVAVSALAATSCGDSDGEVESDAATTTTTTVPPVPVSVPYRPSEIGQGGTAASLVPPHVEVAYGSDPQQKMNVYASAGESVGTIMYIHGGGWNGSSKDETTSPLMMSTSADFRDAASAEVAEIDRTVGQEVIFRQIQSGWDVVSINYRLATAAPGPGIRAPQLMNDVDRAVRYTQLHATELGLNMSKFVLSGGSAGGHLALMETHGAPEETFKDPALPPDLAAVRVRIDAVVALVAPTDLNTLWMAGGIAAPGQESLLGCTLATVPAIPGMPPCEDPDYVNFYSPLAWSIESGERGAVLPPAYYSYGGLDTLVTIETQGKPNVDAWGVAGGVDQTWYDFPPEGGHNIDFSVNYIALNAWLRCVITGNWDAVP
jgi:acetyl esterase/lipase